MNPRLQRLWALLPIVMIALTYFWALGVVGKRTLRRHDSDKTIIRIAHWQLEAGVREGLNEAAAEYQKQHPHVEIRQEAIPESGYGQWLSIQLLGGTAPDIVEIGAVPRNLLLMFYQRYLLPITPYVARPNPYNKGTDLENEPLINTFMDGLRQSYIPEIQEYMTIPLSRMSMRLFYNKTLLKKLTGRNEPPSDFREFILMCEKIASLSDPAGRPYIPISGSGYHLQGWRMSIFSPVTYSAYREVDLNGDGRVGSDEWAIAYLSGRISLEHPAYKGMFELMEEVTRFFQQGWIGLNRDEAIFNFAQQRALFISSGLWEAGGLAQLAEGKFEIGIIDFPLPGPTDPKYGSLIEGPRYENPEGSVPFAVSKTSLHAETAVDFLLFLASREQNARFNARLKWLPLIVGAESLPELKVFEPTLEGVFPTFYPVLGGESVIRWSQLESLFLAGQLSFEELNRQYSEFMRERAGNDIAEYQRNKIRAQARQFSIAGNLRSRALNTPEPEAAPLWKHYREIALRAIESDVSYFTTLKQLNDLPDLREKPIYQYSGQARERIQREFAPQPPAKASTP